MITHYATGGEVLKPQLYCASLHDRQAAASLAEAEIFAPRGQTC